MFERDSQTVELFDIGRGELRYDFSPIIQTLKISTPHFHHKDRFPTNKTYSLVRDFYHQLKATSTNRYHLSERIQFWSQKKKRVTALYPLVHLIGKKRELPMSIDQMIDNNKRILGTEQPADKVYI